MDDDYVSLYFQTNRHETFVNARNAVLVPLLVAARSQSHFARAEGALCLWQWDESTATACVGCVACMEPVAYTHKSTHRGSGEVKLADTGLQHH